MKPEALRARWHGPACSGKQETVLQAQLLPTSKVVVLLAVAAKLSLFLVSAIAAL